MHTHFPWIDLAHTRASRHNTDRYRYRNTAQRPNAASVWHAHHHVRPGQVISLSRAEHLATASPRPPTSIAVLATKNNHP